MVSDIPAGDGKIGNFFYSAVEMRKKRAIGAFSDADFPKLRSSTYVLTQIERGRNIAPTDTCSKPKLGNVEGVELLGLYSGLGLFFYF